MIDWLTPIFLLIAKFAPLISFLVGVFAIIFYVNGWINKKKERKVLDLDRRIKEAQLKKLENGDD